MGQWLTYYRQGNWRASLGTKEGISKKKPDALFQSESSVFPTRSLEMVTSDGWILEARPTHPGGWVWVRRGEV